MKRSQPAVFAVNKNVGRINRRVEIWQPEYGQPLLAVVLLLAADGRALGERGVDVEIVGLLFGRLEFRFLLRGNALRRA